jgi:hypothetical protein
MDVNCPQFQEPQFNLGEKFCSIAVGFSNLWKLWLEDT